MSWGPTQYWECYTASGASTSSYIDVGYRSFSRFAVRYVTMSTGALVSVYGCNTPDGTFLPINDFQPNTATAGVYVPLTIGTNVSGGWGVFPAPPFRYLKFITSAVVSGGVSYTIQGSD